VATYEYRRDQDGLFDKIMPLGSAGVGPLYEVREPGPKSVLRADVQVRIAERVDRCDGSRGQEPLRTGSRQIAAFHGRPSRTIALTPKLRGMPRP